MVLAPDLLRLQLMPRMWHVGDSEQEGTRDVVAGTGDTEAGKDVWQVESYEHAQILRGTSASKRWVEVIQDINTGALRPGGDGHHLEPLPPYHTGMGGGLNTALVSLP